MLPPPPALAFCFFLHLTPNCHTLKSTLTIPSFVNVGEWDSRIKRGNFSLDHTLIFMLSHLERKTVDSERYKHSQNLTCS
jgi:hypothetical protein